MFSKIVRSIVAHTARDFAERVCDSFVEKRELFVNLPEKENTMSWTNREHRDGDRRRERYYEKQRALQALSNAALILIVGFVALAWAFARAWTN